MGENSGIGWTSHTFNVAWGCVEADDSCDNCYAREQAKRYGWNVWGPGATRRTFGDTYWAKPLKWDEAARLAGRRARVFSSSMTDLFLNDRTIDSEREKLWPLIRSTPNLDWQLLTKHPERVLANLPSDWGDGYPNVWFGVTVGYAGGLWRIPMLQRIPAHVRFLSVEPMTGEIDLRGKLDGIGWVIVGGESGHHARPMELPWAVDVMSRALDAGAAIFVKQLGTVWSSSRAGHRADPHGTDWTRWPRELRIRQFPIAIGAAA